MKWADTNEMFLNFTKTGNVHARQKVIPSRVTRNIKKVMVKTIRSHISERCYEVGYRQYAI